MLLPFSVVTGWSQTLTNGDWVYFASNNAATISSYIGPGGSVAIPSSLDGIPVTGLWSGGEKRSIFGWSNTTVVTVAVPNSVTNIDMFAFQNCTELKSVVIPDSVRNIGMSAFYGCSSLESIVIPEGVAGIQNSVLSGCSSLTTVSLPTTATNIGVNAFTSCSSLTRMTIPNNVRRIGLRAFLGCSNLASVIIGSNVTTIDSSAFNLTPNLTSVLFRGSAPSNSSWASGLSQNSTIYYLSAVVGWPATYGGRATQVFQPAASGSGFSMSTGFQFSWTNTGSIPMNVRRTSSLGGLWTVVSTNNATGQFVDPNPPSGKAFYQAYLP